MNKFETYQSKIESQELKPAKIALHFFRHSIKESNDVTLPNDEMVKLSQAGKELAIEKSFDDVNIDQAVAFGSPRIRTQETAMLMMTGQENEIDGTETIEELKEKLNKDLKVGSKIGVDERLNFADSNDTPVGRALNDAYARGEYVKFMVQESDKLAKEVNDESGVNYSAKAAQIAQIIQKYIGIVPQWQKLVSDESKDYTDTLERYMGTHAGVQEAFLAKLLEVTQGVEVRDEFVAKYPNSFDYIQGFEVDITKDSDKDPVLQISINIEGETITKNVPLKTLSAIAGV
jgi:hypothetical protein